MIRTLRAFFLSRLFREKLLLVGFLGLAVVMWASALSSRGSQFWRAQNATTEQLKMQDFWLGRKDDIEATTRAAAAEMDPSKTLDATSLSVAVRQIAADAGIAGKINTSNVSTAMSTGQFSINTMRVNLINGVDWPQFRTFYQRLQERAPYLAITDMTLQPMRGNPAQITATLNVASFEQKHP